jgi:multicomponent K+:H+ antiporter subunit D
MLVAHELGRFAGFSVIATSGTLLAATGLAVPGLTAGALYYLASSTLAACALFLLVELVGRVRTAGRAEDGFDDGSEELEPFDAASAREGTNLDDAEQVLTGRPLPATLAFLGLGLGLCALVIAGLPPLSGFVAKVAILSELPGLQEPAAWTLFGLLLLSGLLATIGLVRAGMRHFWSDAARAAPQVHPLESLPLVLLLGICVALALQGDPALRYARAAAEALHAPRHYVEAVMGATPVARTGAADASPGVRP